MRPGWKLEASRAAPTERSGCRSSAYGRPPTVADPWVATGMGFVESTGQAMAFIGAAAAMAHTVVPARAGSAQGLLRGIGLVAATLAAAASGLAYQRGGALLLFGGTAAVVLLLAGLGLLLARSERRRRRPV